MGIARYGNVNHIPDDPNIKRAIDWRNWNNEQTQKIIEFISDCISRDMGEKVVIDAADALEMLRNNAFGRVAWNCLNEVGRLDLIGLNPDGTTIADRSLPTAEREAEMMDDGANRPARRA